LIFKPIGYLTIAYALVTSSSLIALAIISLINQNQVRTSLFYASIEILFMEVLLLVVCIIDDRKKTTEHFDYQIYKIDNEFSATNVPHPQ
jgi:hypothetical protein